MIFYYLNLLKIKLKYIFSFLYFDFYKFFLKLYFILYKGPNLSFSFFNTRSFIFNEFLFTRSVVSPFFVFFLVNRGLWYILNFKLWLGSRLTNVKPQLNVLRSNLRNMPLKYNRKKSILRVITYHISVLQRNFFVKFLILLFIFDFLVFFNFFFNFYLVILFFYFLNPFFYNFIFYLYINITKLFSIGIKLNILKPVSINLNNNDYVGGLNNNLFLNNSGYFLELKKLFNKFFLVLSENLKLLEKKKTLVLFTKNKNKNVLNDANLFSFIDFFNSLNKFWSISKKQDKTLNNFFYNFVLRRLLFYRNNYFMFFYKTNISRLIGYFYLEYLKNLINKNFISILNIKFIKNLIIFFLLLLIIFYIYFYVYFFYIFFIFILIIFFIVFDFIIYSNNFLKNKILFFDYYLFNNFTNYNLEVTLRLNYYDNFYFYNLENFNFYDYLLLLKLEINISSFEFFLNNLILEQEFFYKKKEIILNTDNLILKRQILLNKYYILFKNHFKNYCDVNENMDIRIKKSNKDLEKELFLVKNKSVQYFIVLKNKITEYNELFFLENNINNNNINNLILSDLNINQRYYYITYGLKLLK